MRFTHRLALLAVVLLSTGELRAQNSPWFEARSAHFLLFTDTSAAKGRQLLTDFESRVAELEKAFGAIPPRQFPIEVFLFKKPEDFTEVVPVAQATIEKTAYLFRGPDRVFVAARDKSPEMIANDVGHVLDTCSSSGSGGGVRSGCRKARQSCSAQSAVSRIRKRYRRRRLHGNRVVESRAERHLQRQRSAGSLRIESHRLLRLLITEQSSALRDTLYRCALKKAGRPVLRWRTRMPCRRGFCLRRKPVIMPRRHPTSASMPQASVVSIHRGDLFLARARLPKRAVGTTRTVQTRALRALC